MTAPLRRRAEDVDDHHGHGWLAKYWRSGPDARAEFEARVGRTRPIVDKMVFHDSAPLPGFRWFKIDDAGRLLSPLPDAHGVHDPFPPGRGFVTAEACPGWDEPEHDPPCLYCGWSGYQQHILPALVDLPTRAIVWFAFAHEYVLVSAEFAGDAYVVDPQWGVRGEETVRSARVRLAGLMWAPALTEAQTAGLRERHPGLHIVSTAPDPVHKWLWSKYGEPVFRQPHIPYIYGQICRLQPIATADGIFSWNVDLGLDWPRSTGHRIGGRIMPITVGAA